MVFNKLYIKLTSEIRYWVYDPSADSEGLLNKFVTAVDPPYCHCEIQTADGMACSIHMNSTIHLKQRKFTNEGYTCIRIPCTHSQSMLARSKMQELYDQTLRFSLRGMLLAHYNVDGCASGHTFCSKIAADVLRSAGIITTDETLSPSGLYNTILKTIGSRVMVFSRKKEILPVVSSSIVIDAIDWRM